MDTMDSLFGDDEDVSVIPNNVTVVDTLTTNKLSNLIHIQELMQGVGGGRGIFASHDIAAGTLLLSEIPSITFMNLNANKSDQNSLNNKYDMANAIEAIVKSRKAYECSKHLYPCSVNDMDAVEAGNMKDFLTSEDDDEQQSSHSSHSNHSSTSPTVNLFELLVSDMSKLNQKKTPTDEYFPYIAQIVDQEILRIALVLQHNCFGSGLYKYISFINHSCMPNCMKFSPTAASLGGSEIYATKNIAKGCEITINYCYPGEMSVQAAQDYLLNNHCFKCNCYRCSTVIPASIHTRADNPAITTDTVSATAASPTIEQNNDELLSFIDSLESELVQTISPAEGDIVMWKDTSQACKKVLGQTIDKCAVILGVHRRPLDKLGLLYDSRNSNDEYAYTTPITHSISGILLDCLLRLPTVQTKLLNNKDANQSASTPHVHHHSLTNYTALLLLHRCCRAALRAGHVLMDHYTKQIGHAKLSSTRQLEQRAKCETVCLQLIVVSVMNWYIQSQILDHLDSTNSTCIDTTTVTLPVTHTHTHGCCEHPDIITTYIDLENTIQFLDTLQRHGSVSGAGSGTVSGNTSGTNSAASSTKAPTPPPSNLLTAANLLLLGKQTKTNIGNALTGAVTAVTAALPASVRPLPPTPMTRQKSDIMLSGVIGELHSLLFHSECEQDGCDDDLHDHAEHHHELIATQFSRILKANSTALNTIPPGYEYLKGFSSLLISESTRLKRMYNTMLNCNAGVVGKKPLVATLRAPGDVFWG